VLVKLAGIQSLWLNSESRDCYGISGKLKGMTTPDFAKLLADNWSSFFGAFIGACVGHLVIHSCPPNVGRLRRQLGRALDRFRDVPSERLDAALHDVAVQRGWRTARLILATTFSLGTAIISFKVFEALFPELSHWLGSVVCGLVAGMLAWAFWRLERMAILRRLERLHQRPLPNAPAV
jgi:uncharacterized membrane protein YeaQ/YmgE (transglycosylase-associated protein family)